jgi:ABC-type nitrate/sulfonate/bicarbonate transport system permease component
VSGTRATHVVAGVLGVVALALAWELAGRARALGPSWPPLSAVGAYALEPMHRALLAGAAGQTAREALAGYGCGAVAGTALAALALLVPAAAPGLERLAAVVNGVPIIAVGSVCAVTFPPAVNPVLVAALGTFFLVYVAASAGLAAATRAHRELFAALGASRATTLRRLAVPAAIPALVDGLRFAAPVAVVGAIIGEWFAGDRGLGPLLVNAMQNYQVDLLWAAALLGAVLSALAYAALGAVRAAAVRRFAP